MAEEIKKRTKVILNGTSLLLMIFPLVVIK